MKLSLSSSPLLVLLSLTLLTSSGLVARPAQAQVLTFTATDSGAQPGDTFTNSDAAATQFDVVATVLGSEKLVTFESAPVGDFTSLNIAPGVTVSGTDYAGDPLTILNVPDNLPHPAHNGFNTTLGGSNYINVLGGTVTFTFAAPIQAFGLYFTGIQPYYYQDTVSFSDGTSQFIDVPSDDTFSGGVSFVGFTDTGKSISRVTIFTSDSNGQDYIGLDDLRYVSTAPVPEASTTVSFGLLLALGLGGVMVAARKKTRMA